MSDEINTLWALIAALLLLVASAGLVLIVEGSTRRRIVSSGSARHVASVVGAVLGVFVCGYALGEGPGHEWFGTEGFLLQKVDLASRASLDSASQGALIVHSMSAAILFSTIVATAVAERATFVSHLVLGLLSGGAIVPLLARALRPEGLLGSISIGESTFTDATASLFATAGWVSLVGAVVVGPRLGRLGSTGDFRVIPGKSTALVSVGAMVFLAGATGFASVPSPRWVDEVGSASLAFLLAGSAGALLAAVLVHRSDGAVSGAAVMRGLVAGVVAASGSPLEISPVAAVFVGAVGGVLSVLALLAVERAKIDDPVGAIAIFGVAGIWGSLAVQPFDVEQFFAQLAGQLIVAAVAIVVAGVLFAALRVLGILRLSPEVELVGLDS